jgi:hypothetical protein
VQTFLPYADFATSAAVLDDRRLGKQRVETFQVLRALTWPSYGWKHHPVVKMWRGFTDALVSYGVVVCREWERRGHADAVAPQLLRFAGGEAMPWPALRDAGRLPPWIGAEPVHLSHRSALVRKEPEHYRPLFGDVPDDLPYVWPQPLFPRWPVRRGRADAASLDEALALLGLAEAWPVQRDAVASLVAGRDVTVRLPPGAGATTTALLAGLCTPGTTLWVLPGTPLPDPVERVEPAPSTTPAVTRDSAGRTAPSIAREPSPADTAAMAAEAAAAPEFRFVRAAQLASTLISTSTAGVGLVVLDNPPDGARNERPGGAAAGLAAPVLRLTTDAESREP